jgi:hypothetical protein
MNNNSSKVHREDTRHTLVKDSNLPNSRSGLALALLPKDEYLRPYYTRVSSAKSGPDAAALRAARRGWRRRYNDDGWRGGRGGRGAAVRLGGLGAALRRFWGCCGLGRWFVGGLACVRVFGRRAEVAWLAVFTTHEVDGAPVAAALALRPGPAAAAAVVVAVVHENAVCLVLFAAALAPAVVRKELAVIALARVVIAAAATAAAYAGLVAAAVYGVLII